MIDRLKRHEIQVLRRFSQHDFGEVWVTYQDGAETKVHVFASRLKYSR